MWAENPVYMAVMTTSISEEVSDGKKQPLETLTEVTIDSNIKGTSQKDIPLHCASAESTLNQDPKNFVEPNSSDELNGGAQIESLQIDQTVPSEIPKPSSQSNEPNDTSSSKTPRISATGSTDPSNLVPPKNGPVNEVSNSNISTLLPTTISDISIPNPSSPSIRDKPLPDLVDEQLSLKDEPSQQMDNLSIDRTASENQGELNDLFKETSTGELEPLCPDTDIGIDVEVEYPTTTEQVEVSDLISKDIQNDTEMVDGHKISSKFSREREDDEEVQPSAKRAKIAENCDISDAVAPSPKIEGSSQHQPPPVKEEDLSQASAITAFQAKELIKILRNIARTNAGKNFRQPVSVLWPTIADNYAAKIPNPMDLSTIERKLKEEAYSSLNDIKADVHLIYNNSVTFNSAENPVSKCAMETRNALFSKISSLPAEPSPVPKKEKKAVKRSTQTSDNRSRGSASRGSLNDAHPAVNHAVAKSPAQAFALDPTTNTPLIRRDSSKGDGGRPKREIHPPKNKDLTYSVRPKNKKHLSELKFCEETLNELQKSKYNNISHPFLIPVDPVALGIPNYFAIIKKPMDISTVAQKLKDGIYANAHEFEKDIRQIFINCYKYNPEGNPVRQMGQSFEEVFNNYWTKKDQYIADNNPTPVNLSDKDSEDDDSDDDEGIDGSIVTASLMSQKERLLEEQSKLINMMGAKHKDEGLLQMQTDLVELIQKRVKAAEEQAKKAVNKKKGTRITKKSAPVKKSAPPKKASVKKKYLGTLEKETISAGLGLLPAQIMANVVEMIKAERPELADAGDETMELDIDSISDTVLWQIHVMIMKHVPHLEAQIRESMNSEPHHALRTAKPATKKKNKPMSKHEQERKIEALTNLDSEFSRASFGPQDHMNTVLSNSTSPQVESNAAIEQESSGDEDSDSEEE